MRITRSGRSIALLLSIAMVMAGKVEAQTDQSALAQKLIRGTIEERSQALVAVHALGASNAGPELRAALFAALESENKDRVLRREAVGRGESVKGLGSPEFIGEVISVVAELRDPKAIPALTGALGTGFGVINALAAFGEHAAPAVLAVVTSPQSRHYAVNDGLITLRFMVEGTGPEPLSPATLEQVRLAAEQRLKAKPRFISTTWWAIDLAGVLNDPDLRRELQILASDRSAVIAKGVSDPGVIKTTQARAADRLAGIPPLPRWVP